MYPRCLIIALAVLAAPASGVPAQDHLEPERGSLNESDSSLAFAKSLRGVLLKDAATYYRARVICLPSFKPAWVVTLVYEEGDRPAFFVEYAVFEGRPGVPIEDSEVKKARAGLDREIAESVQEVWLRMLRRVRHSERPRSTGADGVDYHFSRFVPLLGLDPKAPPGWESGLISTPESRLMTGQLAGMGAALKDYSLAPPDERLKLQEDIRARARRLLGNLDPPHQQ